MPALSPYDNCRYLIFTLVQTAFCKQNAYRNRCLKLGFASHSIPGSIPAGSDAGMRAYVNGRVCVDLYIDLVVLYVQHAVSGEHALQTGRGFVVYTAYLAAAFVFAKAGRTFVTPSRKLYYVVPTSMEVGDAEVQPRPVGNGQKLIPTIHLPSCLCQAASLMCIELSRFVCRR